MLVSITRVRPTHLHEFAAWHLGGEMVNGREHFMVFITGNSIFGSCHEYYKSLVCLRTIRPICKIICLLFSHKKMINIDRNIVVSNIYNIKRLSDRDTCISNMLHKHHI